MTQGNSRRYSDPTAYLLTPEQWSLQRAQFCQLVGKRADPAPALAVAQDEQADALGELEQLLASGKPDRDHVLRNVCERIPG